MQAGLYHPKFPIHSFKYLSGDGERHLLQMSIASSTEFGYEFSAEWLASYSKGIALLEFTNVSVPCSGNGRERGRASE